MQAKGLVRFFSIALTIVCVYQLTFTFKAYQVEKRAKEHASSVPCTGLSHDSCTQIQKVAYEKYLDSLETRGVYNLLVKNFTWEQVQDNRLNLGLDLQGGMSVILEASVEDILIRMAGPNSNDPDFRAALTKARNEQARGADDFLQAFLSAYQESNPNDESLGLLFGTSENAELFPPGISNSDASDVLETETSEAIDRTFDILQSRIDKFGVASPNIQRLATSDRILVELPGVDNPTRVRKILQATAKLEFWETWKVEEVYDYLQAADKVVAQILKLEPEIDTTRIDSAQLTSTPPIDTGSVALDTDTGDDLNFSQFEDTPAPDSSLVESATPLLDLLHFNTPEDGISGPVVGVVSTRDTHQVKELFRMEEVQEEFTDEMKFLWGKKPNKETELWELYCIKIDQTTREAPLTGEVVTDAFQGFDQMGSNANVQMTMNGAGTRTWDKLTAKLAPKGGDPNSAGYVAVVLDDEVYSCPRVNQRISGGRTEISGNFEIKEAQDLANVLQTGRLPAPAKIVQESQVGPTLGSASVQAGVISMVVGLLLTLLLMVVYYSNSGMVANMALLLNVFFIIGIMAALQSTLTLPGIAGLVLTLGMAVDANVLIYERAREELKRGKGLRGALYDGFKHAASAIIDSNITGLITAIILFYFGMGLVKGFATVLILGIISSLFTAVLVSRLVFERMLNKNRNIRFGNKVTLNILANANFNFLGKRKVAYILSGIVLAIGLGSFVTKGFQLGVDFKGGRTYDIAFDKPVQIEEVRKALTAEFGTPAPLVKEVSLSNKVNITTSYLIDSAGREVDSIVHTKVMNALRPFYTNGDQITYAQFISTDYTEAYNKVEPTIADDIKKSSVIAVVLALIGIFIYIFIRFRRWQFSVSAVLGMAHDVLITLAVFSIFAGILPMNMEVDQIFIAALLTVMGYSINDKVVVFDRVREHINDPAKHPIRDKINTAINKTLGRTLMVSGNTVLVSLVLLIFGGDVIRGFSFAITFGVIIGTYSSIFVASPLIYDLWKKKEKTEKLEPTRARIPGVTS
jgi:SecD/SecF fusion protein